MSGDLPGGGGYMAAADLPTPDGFRYLAMIERRVPLPFHFRWLLPALCRRSTRRWVAATWTAWILASVGVFFLAPTWQTGLAAALMFAALPGIRYNLGAPILVDLPTIALAVWAAVAADAGWWPAAITLSVLAGMCKETGPMFAAAFAWSPVLLVGLVAPLVRLAFRVGATDPILLVPGLDRTEFQWVNAHPFRAAQKYHHWLAPIMFIPWGGALVAFGNLNWQLVVVLALGYVQLLVATDTVRLYQWAAPAVCVAAATAVPVVWLPLLVIVTVWNPHAGNGV